jgi:hypothetical protein
MNSPDSYTQHSEENRGIYSKEQSLQERGYQGFKI